MSIGKLWDVLKFFVDSFLLSFQVGTSVHTRLQCQLIFIFIKLIYFGSINYACIMTKDAK